MLLTLVSFFIVLGILVVVHELGHFFAARSSGVKVEEFGLGLPPRIFGIYKDETGKFKPIGLKTKEAPRTIYSLNWIPLGGFVRIKGEEGENRQDPDSFGHKGVWRRIWIVSAGVFMNAILAAVLLSVGLTIGSPQLIESGKIPADAIVSNVKIEVVQVLEGSPAAKADFRTGDIVVALDNTAVSEVDQLQSYLAQKVGTIINVTVKRDKETIIKQVTPQVLSETSKAGLGVGLVQTGFISYPWYIAWWHGIMETGKMIGGVIFGFYLILKSLIISHQVVGQVYGPVGIASLVGDAARMGFLYVLQFTAVLSVIIAVMNFLPFPALDGGRVFFLLIEAIRKKPINQRLETAMHNLGFALLMILVVIVTFQDIARVSSGFLNWWQKLSGLL